MLDYSISLERGDPVFSNFSKFQHIYTLTYYLIIVYYKNEFKNYGDFRSRLFIKPYVPPILHNLQNPCYTLNIVLKPQFSINCLQYLCWVIETLIIMDPTNINTLFKHLENHIAYYRVIPFKDRVLATGKGAWFRLFANHYIDHVLDLKCLIEIFILILNKSV